MLKTAEQTQKESDPNIKEILSFINDFKAKQQMSAEEQKTPAVLK